MAGPLSRGCLLKVRAAFPTAAEIAPQWHLRMQAAVQRRSRPPCQTVNLPATATVDDVRAIYVAAWKAGQRASRVCYGSREGRVLSYAAQRTILAQADTNFAALGRSCGSDGGSRRRERGMESHKIPAIWCCSASARSLGITPAGPAVLAAWAWAHKWSMNQSHASLATCSSVPGSSEPLMWRRGPR